MVWSGPWRSESSVSSRVKRNTQPQMMCVCHTSATVQQAYRTLADVQYACRKQPASSASVQNTCRSAAAMYDMCIRVLRTCKRATHMQQTLRRTGVGYMLHLLQVCKIVMQFADNLHYKTGIPVKQIMAASTQDLYPCPPMGRSPLLPLH